MDLSTCAQAVFGILTHTDECAYRHIIQVESVKHGGSSCQFEPDALVNAIKHIVESHIAARESSHAPSNGSIMTNDVQADVKEAPPVGFHDL